MTILDPRPRPGHDGRDAAKPDPGADTLTLPSRPGTVALPPRLGAVTLPPRRRLKVTLVLNAAELTGIKAPERHFGHPIAGSHTETPGSDAGWPLDWPSVGQRARRLSANSRWHARIAELP